MSNNLCLGTAQLGLPYGVTNARGQVTEKDARKIISTAKKSGFKWIDTAEAYGNSVGILGQILGRSHEFKIISKIKLSEAYRFQEHDIASWENKFFDRCIPKGEKSLDTLLLHDPAELKKENSELMLTWLYSLKKRGLVNRLGISIYSAKDLENVPESLLEVVQLPISLYDQRLIQDGTISRLYSRGCAIHARSIFLQGLLVSQLKNWPSWVSNDIVEHHLQLTEYCEQNLFSLMDLALGFIRSISSLETAIVGVTIDRELAEIAACWKSNITRTVSDKEWARWAIEDSTFVDPRQWPSR